MHQIEILAHLEIEQGRVRLPSGELEGAEKDSDPYSDAVREEEALAQIADGIGHAGDVYVIADIAMRSTRRRTLSTLKLRHGLA